MSSTDEPLADSPAESMSRPPTMVEVGMNRAFIALTRGFGWAMIGMLVGILLIILWAASPAIQEYHASFLFTNTWDAAENREGQTAEYGIAPAIVGTLYTSAIAIVIGGFFGVTAAVFISQGFLPSGVELLLKNIVELLAAIPSVVYGLWGIAVIVPWFQGLGIMPASLVLAIMILPTVTAISREAIVAVPPKLRDAAYGLGATRWEAIMGVVLPTAATGIFGSLVLAFGRALGETMALAMLVGNKNILTLNPLSPSNTLAALMANKFPEAEPGMEVSALMYAGFVLLVITLAVNVLGSLVMMHASRNQKGL
ncbi:phosphate ABC transporter permease subunit PstC [Lignipirellula cremea]|uniref:Phosphate transport system permease protein n=1 Tax=Lignipirellula cremea TaxID=2528010 RepID=A0A518DPY5_9BACT|nr:phosphate ABC transporter permease subunit PstC [Lignipirellula cremea]QDU93899.1 Phosphate transport system permease protein PstC [Lignipirellula cremea]